MSHSKIEFHEATLTIEAAQGNEGQPSIPRAEIVAYTGAPLRVGGWKNPVYIDMAGVEASDKPIPIYRSHDPNRIVGHGTAKVVEGKIVMDGVMSGDESEVGPITASASRGFPWQASVGFQPTKVDRIEANKSATVNGQTVKGPAYVAREGYLYEVSIVPVGADRSTAASIAAQQQPGGDLVSTTESPAETSTVQAGQQNPNIDGVFESIRAKRDRQNRIAQLAQAAIDRGGDLDRVEKLTKQAIEADWTPQDFELQILRQVERHHGGPAIHAERFNVDRNEVVEAALAITTGLPNVEEHYSEQVLEAANKQFKHGIGLKQILAMAARQNGWTGDVFVPNKQTLQAAFAPVQATSFSGLDIGGILSNVGNKQLAAGFNSVESTWREVSAIGRVNDFKEITRYSLTGDMEYEKLGAGGQIKHGSLGELSYTNKAETYAKMLAITRNDIINDDLGALDNARTRLGRGAALKFNKVFWTEWLADNSTFFTTGRGNYFEGAATNLQVSSLTTAEQMFLDQTDADGQPLGLAPKKLVVPNALSTTADVLMRSLELRDTTASTKYMTMNPHAGKFAIVRSSYLNNANVSGGSSTAWWMIADPMDLALIEVVFLFGQQSPTVEAADADFDQLGIQMRGYHDFGVNKQEYRAGVKSKGAA